MCLVYSQGPRRAALREVNEGGSVLVLIWRADGSLYGVKSIKRKSVLF